MKPTFLSLLSFFVKTHIGRLTLTVPLRGWPLAISILMWGVTMNACAADSMKWKEEVVLHDRQKIIVQRSQSYGGQHEIGQTPPIKEQDIAFTLPGSSKTITWKSEYGEDIGRSNFKLLALHILKDTPYIVAVPNLCLSYNKWGRPNPPYVIFKYDGKKWQRIPLSEFPSEFKEINLVINTKGEEKIITAQSLVTADLVRKLNGELEQPEYKTILREALKGGYGITGCEEMVRVKDGWVSPGGAKAPIPITPPTPSDVKK